MDKNKISDVVIYSIERTRDRGDVMETTISSEWEWARPTILRPDGSMTAASDADWRIYDATTALLNGYSGENIWEDIIYGIAGYDGNAPLDPDLSETVDDDDVFVAGGIVYRYDDKLGWR